MKPTSNTSIFLNGLQRNVWYAVRVKAETKAGIGEASEVVLATILINRQQHELLSPDPGHPDPGDQPKPEPKMPLRNNQQMLG